MAVTTTGDLNSLYPILYEGSKHALEQEVIMPNLVTVRTASTMAPRVLSAYTQQTAGTIADGGTVSATTFDKTADGTVTPVTVHHMVQLTDEHMMTDPDGSMSQAVRALGFAIARKVDTDHVGLFSSFTSSKGTAGSALTVGNIAAAMAVLHANNVGGQIYGVIHPYQWYDIMAQVTDVASNPVNAAAGDVFNEAMRRYFVTDFQGAMWFQNSNIGTGTAVYGAVFGSDAIVHDERSPYDVTLEREEKTRSTEVHGVIRFGAAINRQAAGVSLLSDASEPA